MVAEPLDGVTVAVFVVNWPPEPVGSPTRRLSEEYVRLRDVVRGGTCGGSVSLIAMTADCPPSAVLEVVTPRHLDA